MSMDAATYKKRAGGGKINKSKSLYIPKRKGSSKPSG